MLDCPKVANESPCFLCAERGRRLNAEQTDSPFLVRLSVDSLHRLHSQPHSLTRESAVPPLLAVRALVLPVSLSVDGPAPVDHEVGAGDIGGGCGSSLWGG